MSRCSSPFFFTQLTQQESRHLLAFLLMQSVNPGVEPAALAVGSYVKLPPWDSACPAPGDTTNCRV